MSGLLGLGILGVNALRKGAGAAANKGVGLLDDLLKGSSKPSSKTFDVAGDMAVIQKRINADSKIKDLSKQMEDAAEANDLARLEELTQQYVNRYEELLEKITARTGAADGIPVYDEVRTGTLPTEELIGQSKGLLGR